LYNSKTITKTKTREKNKVRSSTRNQHTHVSKPVKTVRWLVKNTQAFRKELSNQ
jgi:hypothetical protein